MFRVWWQFLDTDDFSEQDDSALLLGAGKNSGVGNKAYVSDNNFLWDDMNKYIGWEPLMELVDLKKVLQVWLML